MKQLFMIIFSLILFSCNQDKVNIPNATIERVIEVDSLHNPVGNDYDIFDKKEPLCKGLLVIYTKDGITTHDYLLLDSDGNIINSRRKIMSEIKN